MPPLSPKAPAVHAQCLYYFYLFHYTKNPENDKFFLHFFQIRLAIKKKGWAEIFC